MNDKFFPPTNWVIRALGYIWASPNSLLGIVIGTIGLLTGGGVLVRRGCLEFFGGAVGVFLRRVSGGVSAMTLGHTILGKNPDVLGVVRDHEQVHVRQYERWGPIFLPAYLGCSAYLWLCRRNVYLDNPFEVEAFRLSDPYRRLPQLDVDSNADPSDDRS